MASIAQIVLLLTDAELPVNADNINKVAKAANITVRSFEVETVVRALSKKSVESIIASAAVAAPSAAAAAPVAAAAAAPVAAAKKVVEEKKEESDDDMGMGLFD
ncbi:60S acidic ribosomal protein P1 beta [Cavenderia fasciculata]|uniref:60S acidic ribosomal protein P1 beta n=1 Tax=Cavenderia fasciculata TaxID=261658 RepID=F4Q1Q9_CACFS|nr:60S acidic ribosomal protein P1 beta [Cavenderia fasciculata]EGG18209.1 60S acidic ribosomal protein P1 beta [Cavenderia fasciculata]|eukprot:XP_004357032.1 60S acidic ribosomal protein P1 beta [Cavenderia fasciculata]